MSEIEKLYENAGVKPLSQMPDVYSGFKNICEDFTAEKQIEIIKVISTNHISSDYSYKYLGIDIDEIDNEIYFNLCIDGRKYHAHAKDFAITLAKLVNLIWQDLTEQEQQQIREILQ